MKKIVFTCLLSLFGTFLFAQQTIENPDYGFSTIPGKITKIKLLDTTTVLYFKLKMSPGSRFAIPKQTYIQDLSKDEKLYVKKGVGVQFKDWEIVPNSGNVVYQLYFPKLDKHVKTIEYGEANEGGNWKVLDIVINEDVSSSLLPKTLRGNWLLADGSNRWDYGFNSKNAIIDKAIWHYKSVDKKKNIYAIVLEKEGETKTVYAKPTKQGKVDFGTDLKKMKTYSLNRTQKTNYSTTKNNQYSSEIFKFGVATYSGVIKGFSSKVSEKTGTINVDNVFTTNRETHKVKIADNGSFSIKIPIVYPQSISVNLPGFRGSVFIEQGKETFHYINSGEHYFMGDCAQINSDLQRLKFIDYFDISDPMEKSAITSPNDYKKLCYNLKDKQLHALDSINKIQPLSAKVLHIKTSDIKYQSIENLLMYSLYRNNVERRNKFAKSAKDKIPYKTFEINNSYYSFLSDDIINDELAVVSNQYARYISLLLYADIFRASRFFPDITTAYIAKAIEAQGKKLSKEQLKMVEMSKTIETPEAQAKQANYEKQYSDVEQMFYRKHLRAYNEFLKTNPKNKKHYIKQLNVADYVLNKGEALTLLELEMIEALKALKTAEEQRKEKEFIATYGNTKDTFYSTYENEISKIKNTAYDKQVGKKLRLFFGDSDAFLLDVLKSRRISRIFENFEYYQEEELKKLQNTINNSFIAYCLELANDKIKADIEANKKKSGYYVNTLNKADGEELFEAIIKKFKGKVVYIDFWATWCGPCIYGINKIEPLKKEMEDKDVVFLYITNYTSPEGKWKNSIPDIKGEHYRLSNDEWNYLSEKFNIRGIPHYTLVNKKGQVVQPEMAHLPNDSLKEVLISEIEK